MTRHLSPQTLTGWSLALLAAVGPRVQVHASPNAVSTTATSAAAGSGSGALPAAPLAGPATTCAVGMFLDDGACVHVPDDDAFGEDPVGAPEQDALANGHFEKNGRWTAYEQIPRRPERPADYDAYLYPIAPGLPGGKSVVSGYDLDLPDTQQRRGRMHRQGVEPRTDD